MSKRIAALLLTILLILPGSVSALEVSYRPGDNVLDAVRADMVSVMLGTVKSPIVSSVGGEWAIVGLARSGEDVPGEYYADYYAAVSRFVTEREGLLHDKKYTEYSRVVLGLTAAGYDARDVAGYDLTLPLGDFEKTVWQGANGAAYALLALDSAGYDVPQNPEAMVQAVRGMYLDDLLSRQLPDGGFALSETETRADVDITAVALQAMAPYREREEVSAAIELGLECLSKMQDKQTAGFKSWGEENTESIVQVIVAMCALGLAPEDSRFVKNGRTAVSRLLDFYLPGAGFEHLLGHGVNQMSTEQALYALSAVSRFELGLNSLYDMTDTAPRETPETAQGAGLPGKHADVSVPGLTLPDVSFSDAAGNVYGGAILSLAHRGIVTGSSDGLYLPDGFMTRAEFTALIVRGLGLPLGGETEFSDVLPEDYYAEYIAPAFRYGIVTGRSAFEFDPSGYITLEDSAVMISRAARLCGADTSRDDTAVRDMLAQFSDYRTVSGYAAESLAFCFETEILSQSQLTIEPRRNVTRGELAYMVYGCLTVCDLI